MAEKSFASKKARIGVAAVVGLGALFVIWRVTRTSAVAEPQSSFVPASATSAPVASASGSAAQDDHQEKNPGRDRPEKPQVYPTALASTQKIGIPLRPMDLEIFAFIENGDIKNGRDVFPNKPWRLAMIRDRSSGYVTALSLDLDRDGKIDEKWKLTPEEVTRSAGPDENGTFLDEFRLRGGRRLPR